MALYNAAAQAWTPGNHADGASALANASYHAIRTAASTDTVRTVEVFIGGEASSSAINRMMLRRTTTLVATPTNVAPAPLNIFSVAAVAQGFAAATTGPTIATTNHLLNLSMNAFGGIVRWVAAPGEEIWSTGTTQPNAEQVLSSGAASAGAVSDHIIFEEI